MKDQERVKHYWLYTLRLQEDKYYVGITSQKDPQIRIQQHMNGFYSAQWTKKYKPIEAVEVIDIGNITEAEAHKQEMKRTLQYMKKYGYQNVRGGKLNYAGKYTKLGNRFWRAEDFKTLQVVLIMLLAIALLIFKVY